MDNSMDSSSMASDQPTSSNEGQLKKKKKYVYVPDLSGTCTVCGDMSPQHHHFGAVTCYSCRAFFRRTAEKMKDKKKLKCKTKSGACVITIEKRNCIKCRYMKCLEVGMSPDLLQGARLRTTMQIVTSGPPPRANLGMATTSVDQPNDNAEMSSETDMSDPEASGTDMLDSPSESESKLETNEGRRPDAPRDGVGPFHSVGHNPTEGLFSAIRGAEQVCQRLELEAQRLEVSNRIAASTHPSSSIGGQDVFYQNPDYSAGPSNIATSRVEHFPDKEISSRRYQPGRPCSNDRTAGANFVHPWQLTSSRLSSGHQMISHPPSSQTRSPFSIFAFPNLDRQARESGGNQPPPTTTMGGGDGDGGSAVFNEEQYLEPEEKRRRARTREIAVDLEETCKQFRIKTENVCPPARNFERMDRPVATVTSAFGADSVPLDYSKTTCEKDYQRLTSPQWEGSKELSEESKKDITSLYEYVLTKDQDATIFLDSDFRSDGVSDHSDKERRIGRYATCQTVEFRELELLFTQEEGNSARQLLTIHQQSMKTSMREEVYYVIAKKWLGEYTISDFLETIAEGRRSQNYYHYKFMTGLPNFKDLSLRAQHALMKTNTKYCFNLCMAHYLCGHTGKSFVEQEAQVGGHDGFKRFVLQNYPQGIDVPAVKFDTYFVPGWATSPQVEARFKYLFSELGKFMNDGTGLIYSLLYSLFVYKSSDIVNMSELSERDKEIIEKNYHLSKHLYMRYTKYHLGWKRAKMPTHDPNYIFSVLTESVDIFTKKNAFRQDLTDSRTVDANYGKSVEQSS